MATGKIELINLALAKLGESPVTSLEDGTAPANAARLLFDASRRSVLRSYPWNFATRYATIPRLAELDGDGCSIFPVPADCLCVISVNGGDTFERREGGIAYMGEGPLLVKYTADVTDPVRFDDRFSEALCFKLASELAIPIKGSNELTQYYDSLYRDLIARAAAVSAGEKSVPSDDNPYVSARWR